jgi:hypothetical protein
MAQIYPFSKCEIVSTLLSFSEEEKELALCNKPARCEV